MKKIIFFGMIFSFFATYCKGRTNQSQTSNQTYFVVRGAPFRNPENLTPDNATSCKVMRGGTLVCPKATSCQVMDGGTLVCPNATSCQVIYGGTLVCPKATSCSASRPGSAVICPNATDCQAYYDGWALCKDVCQVIEGGTCVKIGDLTAKLNNPNDYENLISCISNNPSAYQSCPACVNSKNFDVCLNGCLNQVSGYEKQIQCADLTNKYTNAKGKLDQNGFDVAVQELQNS